MFYNHISMYVTNKTPWSQYCTVSHALSNSRLQGQGTFMGIVTECIIDKRWHGQGAETWWMFRSAPVALCNLTQISSCLGSSVPVRADFPRKLIIVLPIIVLSITCSQVIWHGTGLPQNSRELPLSDYFEDWRWQMGIVLRKIGLVSFIDMWNIVQQQPFIALLH